MDDLGHELLCDVSYRIERKGRKLNKKRGFINPACSLKDEKESIIHDD